MTNQNTNKENSKSKNDGAGREGSQDSHFDLLEALKKLPNTCVEDAANKLMHRYTPHRMQGYQADAVACPIQEPGPAGPGPNTLRNRQSASASASFVEDQVEQDATQEDYDRYGYSDEDGGFTFHQHWLNDGEYNGNQESEDEEDETSEQDEEDKEGGSMDLDLPEHGLEGSASEEGRGGRNVQDKGKGKAKAKNKRGYKLDPVWLENRFGGNPQKYQKRPRNARCQRCTDKNVDCWENVDPIKRNMRCRVCDGVRCSICDEATAQSLQKLDRKRVRRGQAPLLESSDLSQQLADLQARHRYTLGVLKGMMIGKKGDFRDGLLEIEKALQEGEPVATSTPRKKGLSAIRGKAKAVLKGWTGRKSPSTPMKRTPSKLQKTPRSTGYASTLNKLKNVKLKAVTATPQRSSRRLQGQTPVLPIVPEGPPRTPSLSASPGGEQENRQSQLIQADETPSRRNLCPRKSKDAPTEEQSPAKRRK